MRAVEGRDVKNLKLLTNENEIRHFLDGQFRTREVRDAVSTQPFLQDLLNLFVAKPRVVFDATDVTVERGNFTSWYNALALREYENPAVNDLYYIHEIAHIATMPYAPDVGFNAWKSKIFRNELEASVLSEAFIYFLAPELRGRSFAHEIWVDRYLRATPHPSLPEIHATLLVDRERIQTDPRTEDAQELRINDYQIQNEEWARIWRTRFGEVEAHMAEFERSVIRDRVGAGQRHLAWIEARIASGKKPYPFPDEVEAFYAFSEHSHKGDAQAQAATALKIRNAI